MRALLVVAPAENLEASLPLGGVSGRGLGGLRLHGPVHALMPAIIPRAAGRDIARLDAEIRPSRFRMSPIVEAAGRLRDRPCRAWP